MLLDIISLVIGLCVVAAFMSESMNPFVWLRQIAKWLGFGVGYTPKAVVRLKEEAKTLKAEADLELKESGQEVEMKYSYGKKAGKRLSDTHHSEAIKKAQARREELEAKAANFK